MSGQIPALCTTNVVVEMLNKIQFNYYYQGPSIKYVMFRGRGCPGKFVIKKNFGSSSC